MHKRASLVALFCGIAMPFLCLFFPNMPETEFYTPTGLTGTLPYGIAASALLIATAIYLLKLDDNK